MGKGKLPHKRTLNGKVYELHSYDARKAGAQAVARALREDKHIAGSRVVKDPSGPGYYIYIRYR